MRLTTGTVKNKYFYAPLTRLGAGFGRCIAFVDSANGTHWMHQDAQGSTKVITQIDGSAENAYKYYPFGDSLNFTGTVKNDVKFTGQRYADGIEAYDFNARYYDPELGRFYSIDPLWNPAESPYVYCHNNPVNFTDPTGMAADPVQYAKAFEQMLAILKAHPYSYFDVVDGDSRIRYSLEERGISGFDIAWLVYDAIYGRPNFPGEGGRGGRTWTEIHLMDMMLAQMPHGNSNTGDPTPTPKPQAKENTKTYKDDIGKLKREATIYRVAVDLVVPYNPMLNMTAKLGVLAAEMWPRGHNDPKNDKTSPYNQGVNIIDTQTYSAMDVGNMRFGVFANNLGVPCCVACFGAGVFAQMTGGATDATNVYGGGDNKKDTEMTKKGYGQ